NLAHAARTVGHHSSYATVSLGRGARLASTPPSPVPMSSADSALARTARAIALYDQLGSSERKGPGRNPAPQELLHPSSDLRPSTDQTRACSFSQFVMARRVAVLRRA